MTRAAVITATGSAVPAHVETNDMLAQRLDTSDEWIRQRTGIGQRHVATTETTADLAVAAGKQALEALGPDYEIDQLILATTTPDRACPAVAPEVASRLGLGTIPAYDVAAVCSGFLFALRTARDAILAGTSQRSLVIASETFTRLLDPTDRATVAIFGDGAGAVVVEAGDPEAPGAIHDIRLRSDGALADLITANGNPTTLDRVDDTHDPYFHMQGQAVFLHAVLNMEEITRQTLDAVGWDADSIAHFVGHQANARILHAVADRLDVDAAKVNLHLEHVGNTAGASIPLALDDALRRGHIQSGERIAMASFGGGATWGAAAINAPTLTSSAS
ncbi:beta-ketoacyl-ACP synthase III [Glutamicibacter arilaitensis]|uniref:beta-ketoacyl-ACP synthase III n=1 Tax=Glutamicibacter arilaitensis TaxID=256701 RepID=UPI003FD152A2